MARRSTPTVRKRVGKTNTTATALMAALNFINQSQRDLGQIYQTHCRLANGWAVAYDGQITAAHPIPEAIEACPHTQRLIDALSACGPELAVTALPDRLGIRSGGLRAYVPCISPDLLPPVAPDVAVGVMTDAIKEGFAKLTPLISDIAEHVLTATIHCKSMSMLASNRHVMAEYWHGVDMPAITLPKNVCVIVAKSDKPLKAFGFSQTSFTFWFEDGSWLKTQLYTDPYPVAQFDKILNETGTQPAPVPEGFFDKIKIAARHSEDKRVYLYDNTIRSHKREDGEVGIEIDCPTLQGDWIVNSDNLAFTGTIADKCDLGLDTPAIYFWGGMCRLALSTFPTSTPQPVLYEQHRQNWDNMSPTDDGIPY